MELVFAEIGMFVAETTDLHQNPFIPSSGASSLGRAGLWIKSVQLAIACSKPLFPVKQGAPFNFEGVNGGGQSVL